MDITKRLYITVTLLFFTICFVAVYESFQPMKQGEVFELLKKTRRNVQSVDVTDILTPVVEEKKNQFQSVIPPEHRTQKEQPLLKSFTKEESLKIPQPPKGFFSTLTNNYIIFREQMAVTPELKNFIDTIHGNFILDIIPFSLNAEFKRLFLMLFRTRENFTKYTLRPEWSQAATDVSSRSIYLMEGLSFKPVFVHELTHVYFDSFFYPHEPPLWLSEGYAVYQQSRVQSREENGWLQKNIITLSQKNYINFAEFHEADHLEMYDPLEVELWYTQAYSVVKYLLEKDKDSFYQFSKNLKENMPIGKALYRAYGMPFNSLKALEYAWQAQLQKEVKRGNYYG